MAKFTIDAATPTTSGVDVVVKARSERKRRLLYSFLRARSRRRRRPRAGADPRAHSTRAAWDAPSRPP